MGILVGILVVILNLISCFLLLSIEKKLFAKDEIPKRGTILYLQDYNFFKWGDLWFLSVMDFASAFVLVERSLLPLWVVISCLIAVTAWTAVWHRIWLSRQDTFDSAYPRERTVSLLGRVHLGYFWGQYALGFLGLSMVILMITGERSWSPMAILGLIAAALYFVSLYSDIRSGRTPK